MLRLRDGQSTLWEELLPAEAQLLSTELTAVDSLLDDDRFLRPFVEKYSCPIGRPTIPMETYLRLMYLKHRYGLGYETLVKEVADLLCLAPLLPHRTGSVGASPHDAHEAHQAVRAGHRRAAQRGSAQGSGEASRCCAAGVSTSTPP